LRIVHLLTLLTKKQTIYLNVCDIFIKKKVLLKIDLVIKWHKQSKASVRFLATNKLIKEFKNIERNFFEALNDDFNTPNALLHLFLFMNILEKYWDQTKSDILIYVRKTIIRFLDIFGIRFQPYFSSEVISLIERREIFRGNKQFIQADALRNQINELGYGLEDTPFGPLVWSKTL